MLARGTWESKSQMFKCREVYRAPEIDFLDAEPLDEELVSNPTEPPWRDAAAFMLRKMTARQRRFTYAWIFLERTLQDISKQYGLSPVRIRQLCLQGFDHARKEAFKSGRNFLEECR